MLRFSYILKFFATIFFSQWVAFSANDYKGDVLVDRHKTGSPLRKPLSLTRSYSSPSVMTMGDNEEPSYLSLAQAASKILDRDDVAVAAKKNSSFPPDVQEDRGAAERMDFMDRLLSDSARQPFTDSFALVILVILSQNYISTDSYISFMDSVPLKDRLTIAKALNIDGIKMATEKKLEI